MTTTQLTATVPVVHRSARPRIRSVLAGSVAGSFAAAAVLVAYGAAAIAAHGPMHVGHAADAVPITAASFAIGVLFSSFFGTVLAVALARWAKHPARTFQRAAIALTVVSLYAPFTAQTDTATRFYLAVGHVVAAAIVIPVIVRSLRTRRA